jgi:Pentapeptide repeats (8 copies)
VLAACAVAAVALALAVIWPITDLLAAHDVGTITGASRALHLQTAREAVRTQMLTLGAGLFAAGALIYTARNFTLSRRQLELSQQAMEFTERGQRRTLELTEQGQVTDRYTKAIEQLGSNTIDVTIGGIYALERIARDSPRDHPTVTEVLAACIREHSRDPLPRPTPGSDTPERTTRPDIQAAVTVIGRRGTTNDRGQINLRGIYLPNADLTGVKLPEADLTGADLMGADLALADLTGANLALANLDKANLADANLAHVHRVNAHLTNACFNGAYLAGAHLGGANLAGATLRGTDLTGANLSGADLAGADLALADLTGADLAGASWPPDLDVPEGWQRDTRRGRSGRLKRPECSSDGMT